MTRAAKPPHTVAADLLVTPARAREILGGVSDNYLRKLTGDGLVRVVYIGSHRRVVYASLVELVEKHLAEDPS
jgi:hypothetical protein